ncbi:MAG: hypothetical protein AAGK21_04545 [Bacteroidota bacterium]
MRDATSSASRVTLDQTEAALSGPITALTPTTARAIVDHWRGACQDATEADLSNVADGLSTLRDLLDADQLNGRAIADILAQLAQSTRAAAVPGDERLSPRLETIAGHLDRAASLLSK